MKRGNRWTRRAAGWLVALALAVSAAAPASGDWLYVPGENDPEGSAFRVREFTGTVRITFLGDCTLGGEEKTRGAVRGFSRTIENNGYAYPFRNLAALTAADDLTVANLEGVLSDRDLTPELKEYNFMGPTAYTEILREGSVECVTLANNHTHDYGNTGYADTRAALEAAGIAYMSPERAAVWRNEDGLMIGFIGVSMSLSGNRAKEFRKKAEEMRAMGCSAIITVMHAGTEYEKKPDARQRQVVARAAEAGCCLVIGHHPHIVQGYGTADGMPVVYSLGNCVFGGNLNPDDHDALAVQAELSFEEGTLTGMTLKLYPLSVSGMENRNDFSPVLLSGADAERVLKKMEESTGVSPGSFDPETGAAVIRVSVAEK